MSFKAKLKGYRAPLCAALICSAMIADTFAQAGGRPLILDTQTGIQSGAGGTVLQTGPLNGQGMVPARPLATLPEVSAQQGQQPIVVSPYIEVQPGGYSGPQGYAISPGNQSRSGSAGIHGLRSSAGYSGGLQGMPASVQPHAQPPRSQPSRAQPQTAQQPRSQSPAQPTTSTAPTSAGTDPATISRTGGSKPRTPARSSDPHTATGTVTSLQ
jgi:hypothetical protein